MTAAVTAPAERRTRRAPAWNPATGRHSWEDIDEDGHRHRCVHCWVRYHSAEYDGVWVKVWDHGARSGRAKALGKCPGPSGRPVLTVVAEAPTLEVVAADGGAVPGKPVVAHPCCRCAPPLEPCGRPTRLYLGGWMCAWQAGGAA